MWPFKKKKGINLAPGEGMKFALHAAWRRGKDEVAIMTEKGPILLNDKSECIVEIRGDNIEPIKFQLVPDFRNKVINLVEIIDPNVKYDEKRRLVLTGMEMREINILDEIMKQDELKANRYKKDIEKRKLFRNIVTVAGLILFTLDMYIFATEQETIRYINLMIVIPLIYSIYLIWKSYDELIDTYKRYEDSRQKTFGLVKDK